MSLLREILHQKGKVLILNKILVKFIIDLFTNFLYQITYPHIMTITSPLLFKLGCAGMLSVMALGAKYGHAGRLAEPGAAMFMKAQLYNVTNGK
jgi:hypothetical protein